MGRLIQADRVYEKRKVNATIPELIFRRLMSIERLGTQMNVGVVLVTYNRLEKLKYALQCYSNQISCPLYVLVVDNCSSDGTKEYLEEWKQDKENFEKFVIHMQENTGGAGGFYAGLERACDLDAEWIWVADDDAYPRENAIERLENYYESIGREQQDSIVAVCSAVYNNGTVHVGHRNHVKATKFKVIIKQSDINEYSQEAFDFNMLSYVGSCIRKDALKKAGLDKKDYFIYCDDQEHSLRLNKIGRFVCVPESIVDHDSPPFDENVINWGKYYFKRNGLLMIRENFKFRYFALRFIRRYIEDIILSKKDERLKRIYRAAYHDALFNKKGMHSIYRPGGGQI